MSLVGAPAQGCLRAAVPAARGRRCPAGRCRAAGASRVRPCARPRTGCWTPARPPGRGDRGPLVADGERGRRRVRSERLARGGQQRRQSCVAVPLAPDRVAVEPEDHVLDERAPVDLADVDRALQAVGERFQRAHHVVAQHAHVACEVVARARGHAAERQGVRARRGGDQRHRTVATGHAERVCAAVDRVTDHRGQILTTREHDRLDAEISRALLERQARCGTSARPRLMNSPGRSGRGTGRQPIASRNRSPGVVLGPCIAVLIARASRPPA